MFAGKTEELIRRARRELYAKRSVQVFKPKIDNRYDEADVVTHLGVKYPSIPVSGVEEMSQIIEPETDTVLIEEAQFFDSKLVDLALLLADRGKTVILAGLDMDFRRRPFGPMGDLLAIADEVVKLQAICMHCGAPAIYTYRMVNGKPASFNDPIVLIGAQEKYEARCRRCFALKDEPASRVKMDRLKPRRRPAALR